LPHIDVANLDSIYGDMPQQMHEVLERVQSNGKRLLGLINDVLDLSKIEAWQLTVSVDVKQQVGNA
jgi:signal transduction histidine kinase